MNNLPPVLFDKEKAHRELQFNGKTFKFPGRIDIIMFVKDFVVVEYEIDRVPGTEIEPKDSSLRKIYNEQVRRACESIWAFNRQGSLLWKIREVFPVEEQRKNGVTNDDDLIGSGYVGFDYDSERDQIMGVTCHEICLWVSLKDGSFVEKLRRGEHHLYKNKSYGPGPLDLKLAKFNEGTARVELFHYPKRLTFGWENHDLPGNIVKLLSVDDKIVVLTKARQEFKPAGVDMDTFTEQNKNAFKEDCKSIYCFSFEGKLLWQIEPEASPYVDFEYDQSSKVLTAFTQAGVKKEILL